MLTHLTGLPSSGEPLQPHSAGGSLENRVIPRLFPPWFGASSLTPGITDLDRTEPGSPGSRPVAPGELSSRIPGCAAPSQVQDMQNTAVDRSGLTENRVAVRAIVHAVCSGASRGPPVVEPVCAGFAVGSQATRAPPPNRPAELGRSDWKFAQRQKALSPEPRRQQPPAATPSPAVGSSKLVSQVWARRRYFVSFPPTRGFDLFRPLPSSNLTRHFASTGDCCHARSPIGPSSLDLSRLVLFDPCFARPFRHSAVPRRLQSVAALKLPIPSFRI